MRAGAYNDWLRWAYEAGVDIRGAGKGYRTQLPRGSIVVPFWRFIFRILHGNPNKEQLRTRGRVLK